MTASSGSCSGLADDVRNCVGFSVSELYLGVRNKSGNLRDLIHHSPSHRQTAMYVSSTDPWHRSVDRDATLEQPGLDMVFQGNLTRNLPVLIPVPMLYDVPENAAAEVRYLLARGRQLDGIEAGEEPDGQYVEAEDYGALYLQWTAAIRSVDTQSKLGGPSMSALNEDVQSWMNSFLNYLERTQHLRDYEFFSFEWYPFDNACSPAAANLARAPSTLAGALLQLRRDERLRVLPWLMTEYGYSAQGGASQVRMESALFNAETMAQFLLLGGQRTYLYGYEPGRLKRDAPCAWGGHMLLQLSHTGRGLYPLASYHSARLLTKEWIQPPLTSRITCRRHRQTSRTVWEINWLALTPCAALTINGRSC